MLANHQASCKPHRAAHSLAAGLCIFLLSFSAPAVFADANSTYQQTYQQDRKVCLSGQSNEDQKTCLREAGAARAAAQRGKLSEQTGSYEQNALARCKVLPPADQTDCVRRVHGEGTVSGTVGSGGILRETRTTIIESPPASAPPASVMPQTPPGNIR
jgi:hypothetical protein